MGFAAALAIGGALAKGADVVQQFQNADALEDFQEDRFQATKRAALESFLVQTTDVRVRTGQERSQIASEIENITNEALSRRGSAAAAASSAGVSGQSVADVQLDITRAEDAIGSRLNSLQDFREAAAELRIRNLRLQTQNRITGALPPPIFRPNLVGSIFGIFGSGLSGFAGGQQLGKGFGSLPSFGGGLSLPDDSNLDLPS